MSNLTLEYKFVSPPPFSLPDVTKLPEGPERAFYFPHPRTVVGVKLHGLTGAAVYVRGIIDSGAGMTVIPERLMRELGVDRGGCSERGATRLAGGQQMPTCDYEPGVEVTIAGTWRLRLRPVKFMPGAENIYLGTDGFLDHFDVTLRRSAGAFDLEAHDDVEVLPEAWWMHETPDVDAAA